MRTIPRATVTVVGPGGLRGTRWNHTKVLVDTGARHSQFPEVVLEDIGYDLSQSITLKIHTSNGLATRRYLHVDLEVQGVSVPGVGVYVGANATPLVGRSTLYAAFAATGFRSPDWLWKLHDLGEAGGSPAVADAVARARQLLRMAAEASTPRRGKSPARIKVTDDGVWIGDVWVPRRHSDEGAERSP
ncbi:MAG TPA: aspartyl protease family protein [Thermoleophilaceae bacterium]